MGKCHDCDWYTCFGCPHNTNDRPDMWNDPDYPEYDPTDSETEKDRAETSPGTV